MKRHTAERDGISNLPAPILHHILSFLSQKEAVKTCLLSKSWRHLVSTRPNFILDDCYFEEDKEKFMNVLEKSLQVYYSQKLCIEEFRVSISMVDPESVLLLKKWIPILIHDIGVKKLRISFDSGTPENFESESLQESYLQSGSLRHINSVGKHLKTLHLNHVYIEEETLSKIMSSCLLIEDMTLYDCVGFTTIKMHNHHNLKTFTLFCGRSIEIYLPSTVRYIHIKCCPNWFHHCNYFPRLTRLRLDFVPLSNEWFDSFSRNFPCLEVLQLIYCNGFDKFQLSSRSIENLDIWMVESTTTKATIDAPSIKDFCYFVANISESISFTTTSSSEWNSQTRLSLDLKVSLCFLQLSLTRLTLTKVLLSKEWFNSFSHNFPCLEDLQLEKCKGFDEFQLSSRSIKDLGIEMHKSTIKATIDAPSLKYFHYKANISQYISFSTTSSEWKSKLQVSLNIDSSLWFLKISELVAEFSQSQIYLVLQHSGRRNQHIEQLAVCCSGSYTPVVMKSLELNLNGRYYDSFFSDLMNGLFLKIRPSEINQDWFVDAQKNQRKLNETVEFLCRTLQLGRSEDEGMSFWQHVLEEVSFEVKNGRFEDWHPVRGTISWSEYVAALLPPSEYTNIYNLRFRLKWRE